MSAREWLESRILVPLEGLAQRVDRNAAAAFWVVTALLAGYMVCLGLALFLLLRSER